MPCTSWTNTQRTGTRTATAQGPLYWVDDNFDDDNIVNWEQCTGTWSASNDQVLCAEAVRDDNSPGGFGAMLLLPGSYQDVRLSVDIAALGGTQYGGLIFGYRDSTNFFALLKGPFETVNLYKVNDGAWSLRQSVGGTSVTSLKVEVRSGSVTGIGGMADFNATIPAGRVGLRASATGTRFDNFKVRSLAANCVVDGRFIDDVGNVRVNGGKLEFYNDDNTTRRTVLRHVRMSKGIVRADLTWQAIDCGIILNYQDPENFAVALLDVDAGTITPRYVEFIEGKQQEAKGNSGTSFTLTAGQTYGVQAVVRAQYPANAVRLYVDRNQDGDFGDPGELVLSNFMIFGTWGGGHVGLYRATSTATTTLQWDNFLCGYDNDNDEVIGTVTNPDPGDYLYARYNFDDPGGGATWQTITYAHDANGNLTGDGLYKYTYDAWNRLVGVWYHDCAVDGNGVPSDTNERVARYRYDGLFRRVSKQVLNQGTGVVFRSDDLNRDGTPDATGILAGDRHEHYFYAGWRLVETTNHVTGVSGYSYGDSAVLNQFVYGTQYIDEPVRYDRNLQAGTNRTCIGTGGDDRDASYYYHQDANWRTVALTGEDGQIVERVEYTAYGEPTLFGGQASGGGDEGGGTDVPSVNGELGNAMLVSTVGNPLLHQGLFRDRETLTYHNRFRQYDSRSGRFMQRDPLYEDVLTVYQYVGSEPIDWLDPFGLRRRRPVPVPKPVWDALDAGERETRADGKETGGVVVISGGLPVARRQVEKNLDGTEARSEHDVHIDYSIQRKEEFKGTWHTHPNGHGFSMGDFVHMGAIVRGAKSNPRRFVAPGNLVFYLRTSDGKTYVATIVDVNKAQKCADKGAKALEDEYDNCWGNCMRCIEAQAGSIGAMPDDADDTCEDKCTKKVASGCGVSIDEGRGPGK